MDIDRCRACCHGVKIAFPALAVLWSSLVYAAGDAVSVALITQAGNAEHEQVRFRLLQWVVALPELDAPVKRDLQALLPILDFWANKTYRPPEPRRRAAENGFLCGFFVGKVRPDRYYLPHIAEESPLYPIW